MKNMIILFAFLCIINTSLAKLDMRELDLMKEIGKKFGLEGNKHWDLNHDPCGGEEIWDSSTNEKGQVRVGCDCSSEHNTTCFINSVYIMSMNISSTLLSEFAKFQKLYTLNLRDNYISGTIPSEWAAMRLTALYGPPDHISLSPALFLPAKYYVTVIIYHKSILFLTCIMLLQMMYMCRVLEGNRLSGPFPTVLTNMTTLTTLNIGSNRFSGSMPKEIAKLKNLETLVLSSNGFTGKLPTSFAKFTNLTHVIISDNNFSGKIPKFINKWTHIEILRIEGCSFEGPIPSIISLKQLRDLVLRNCLINGTIPDYVGSLTNLEILDLSFNNLTGQIPSTLSQLEKANYMYFTANNLSGPMPRWVLLTKKDVDVSYNQFTWDASSGPKSCEQTTINVVESYSLETDNKEKNMHPCLRKDFPCTKSKPNQAHSLYINCGGDNVNINSTILYEGDTNRNGASSYHNGGSGNWAFSSTGNFLDADVDSNIYVLSNTSRLFDVPSSDTESTHKCNFSYLLWFVSNEWELHCQTPLRRDRFKPG